MEWFQAALDGLEWLMQSFINSPAQAVAIILGAAGVSVLTQVIKKFTALEKEKSVVAVFTFIAFLASLLDYFISHAANLPPAILGANTAVIMGVAQPIYYYIVKPFSKFWTNYKQYQQAVLNKVDEIEAIGKTNDIEEPVLEDKETAILAPTPVEAPKVEETPKIKVANF